MAAVPTALNTPYAMNTSIVTAVNPYLDRGYSYEDIAALTGIDLDQIRDYADATRPGYGVTSGTVAPSGTNSKATNTGGGGITTPAKVLDTAQLSSLDSLMSSLGAIKDQSVAKAAIKRDTSKREKQEEKDREEGKYKGKKLSTLQDFAGAKTDTDLNTRNTLENLISSLSTLGLGGSRALTRQILDAANMSNRKANATQATNNQNLDSAFNEYTIGNENDMKKIEDQYGYDAGEAERKFLQDKQSALYKKADVFNAADKTAERGQVIQEADSLNSLISGAAFMNPTYTGEARAMATPELSEYTQDIAKYDTTNIGASSEGLTPVSANGANVPGNLAVRAMAVNDKDLGIKKKTEADLGYGV
jgi:hypothetical protein